jgi:hypothetical protein
MTTEATTPKQNVPGAPESSFRQRATANSVPLPQSGHAKAENQLTYSPWPLLLPRFTNLDYIFATAQPSN